MTPPVFGAGPAETAREPVQCPAKPADLSWSEVSTNMLLDAAEVRAPDGAKDLLAFTPPPQTAASDLG